MMKRVGFSTIINSRTYFFDAVERKTASEPEDGIDVDWKAARAADGISTLR